PRKDWPNFVFSRLRGLLLLAVMGTIVVLSTFAGAFGASGGASSVTGVLLRILGVVLSLVLNLALYLLAYRILTTAKVSWADVLPGPVAAAVLWTALQLFGGYIVTHQLQGATNVYGTFAIVIGL